MLLCHNSLRTFHKIRTLVDVLKERGCRPLVTDTKTMPYHPWASRTLAIDHLETANQNGFNQGSMGCPVIIADGWLGTDDVVVDLKGRGNYLNKQSEQRRPHETWATRRRRVSEG